MTVNQRQIPTDAPEHTRQDSTTSSRSIGSRAPTVDSPTVDSTPNPDISEVLDLLADDYVCDILRALEAEPKPARVLAEQCDMSRPTVYRRLDRLTAAGLVESRMSPARDGHHRQEFHLIFDALELQIREEGIDGTVRIAAPAGN